MTKKLKCPFCGTELQHWGEDFLYCENLGCPMSPQIELPISIWQALIDGKKAQRQLRTVKDRCVKKIKAKEREIRSCLNGIHVRSCEIETLHERLRQSQDALKEIYDFIEAGALTMEKAGMPDNKNVYKEMLDKILSETTKHDR